MLMNKEKYISLIIVDDHPVVAEGLSSLLKDKEQLEVIGCFTSGAETRAFLKDNVVDVVLLDISLPDVHGAELCLEIKEKYPEICILAISNHNERSIITQMLQNGASGYILKNSSVMEIVRSIKDGINGKLSLSSEVQSILAKSGEPVQKIPRLTRREKEVLKLVAEGMTTVIIAEKLFISPLTVETHRRNLMQKFDVRNTAALIKSAIEQDLI